MQVGGIKTRWLFADAMEAGKEYVGEISGTGQHAKVPYLIWTGAVADGVATEYQVSLWRVESQKPFDANVPAKMAITAHGKNIFFRPI